MDSSISNALKTVQENINEVLNKNQKTTRCTLVGVSKTKPVQLLQEAYDSGLRHFGENYVDEISEKAPQLPQDIKWHFIGHLQSNKIKQVLVPNLYIIETIDSIKLAEKVQKICQNQNRNLKVLIQIKISDEESKYGIEPENAYTLIEFIIKNCPNLEFSGLMTIGKQGDVQAFQKLYNLRIDISNKFLLKEDNLELSMGMSADYQIAIQNGSTEVRIGSTIFGQRDYSKQ
ncbi:hypothetical protein IMG5_024860 [Ichthyophthirius multifiliis]|uniref:Pyridoxal phosphate homeostasis protein n=1 Tax=Ichthyophthirius multifiliis TaxID=5932 RepID=G0QL41_ICHMU|nr:hypothetical protein IMG5_024860 [Ichthyophthirius multifiliis]EGR34066.1 hypothetical protein IMG5_024860 [Ichthyophthirius multifiliis]|eukprot:XP_004039370.1 hypothetical protein IMG5_024860 [Ichthyophthirius multifiliis]